MISDFYSTSPPVASPPAYVINFPKLTVSATPSMTREKINGEKDKIKK